MAAHTVTGAGKSRRPLTTRRSSENSKRIRVREATNETPFRNMPIEGRPLLLVAADVSSPIAEREASKPESMVELPISASLP